jgi:gas vesicle protein
MINQNQKSQNNIFSVLAGLFVGGLAGAVTMLLLAPQSGEDTRMKIQKKGVELRDRTFEIVEDAVTKARSKTDDLATSGRKKIKELKQQGQELAVEQLDRVSDAAQAGKEAIQGSKANVHAGG